MFSKAIKEAAAEIDARRDSPRGAVMKAAVQGKLDASLDAYYDNLVSTCSYLLSKDTTSMMKALNRGFSSKEDIKDEN